MTKIKCVIDLFKGFQTFSVEINNKEELFNCPFYDLSDTLSQFAAKYDNSQIYLGGLTEEQLIPIKEEILTKSQTEYSNNNIEVILV